MERKYHVGTRSTLRCKLKRKQRRPAVGRYLYALTKPRGDAALESGLAAAEGRVLCAEAFIVLYILIFIFARQTGRQNFTIRGPCIVMYSYNESQRDALFLRFI